MRRVVVTGMGIVSSIGNNAQEVVASLREAKSGIDAAPTITTSSASAARCMAALKIDLDAAGRPPRAPLHGRWRGLWLLAMEAGDRAMPASSEKDISNRRAPA